MDNIAKIYRDTIINNTFMSDLIKEFSIFSKEYYSKDLDSNSIYCMLRQIEGFEKYIYIHYSDISSFKKIEEIHIENFKVFCFEKLKNSNKTINSKLTSLRYFFKFLVAKRVVTYNILLNVPKLRNEAHLKVMYFKHNDLNILFDSMRNFKDGIRGIVLSKIILQTGLEITDILSLQLNNVDIENRFIASTTKDIKYPIDSDLCLNIRHYLILRNELENEKSKDYFFISKTGTPYSIRAFQRFFKNVILETNLDESLCPRSLLNTFKLNMARIATPTELKTISNKTSIEHYYSLLKKNPLRTIK